MRRKDIIRALQEIDEDTAVKLSEEYHGIAEGDHERLLEKIERRLYAEPDQIMPEEVQPARKISIVTRFGAVAACATVCFGTFGGLVWLRMHSPVQQRPETSGAQVPVVTQTAFSVGERYAVPNLTAEGALYVTVSGVSSEDALCHVMLTLESEGAVSRAGTVTGDQTVFQLDNFRAAVETDGGIVYVTPCRAESTGETGLPNTCTLEPGEHCSVELWYALPERTTHWQLITGSGAELPYAEIVMEGTP